MPVGFGYTWQNPAIDYIDTAALAGVTAAAKAGGLLGF